MTIFKIFLSLANTQNPKLVLKHLEDIEGILTLNEVDRLIMKDLQTGAELGKVPTPEFIEQKYSYANPDDELIVDYIVEKGITSAIIEVSYNQRRQSLRKELLDLSSSSETMTPKQLRGAINKLLEASILQTNLEEVTNELIALENPYETLHKIEGTVSHFSPQVEMYSGKAVPGTVISIIAFAGGFKTVAAVNTTYINAIEGKNVLYLALESTAEDIINRLTVNHIAVTAKNTDELIKNNWIRDNKLTKKQKEHYNKKYDELIKALNDRVIIWDETKIAYDTFLDMTETLRTADDLFKATTGKGLDIIMLDQLALLKYTSGGGKRYGYDGAILNAWVSYFRKQSLDFLESGRQIVTFLVSQINRDAYAEASKPKNKGRYDITAASDAHEIERASDTMITLYKDLDTQNTLLVNIPKARRGAVPDNPIQLDVYGEYYHIGYLSMLSLGMTSDDFEAESFDLSELLG